MRCPSCNFENPDKAKFCNECGSPLNTTCPSCQFQNPPNAKFCSECGTALKPSPVISSDQPGRSASPFEVTPLNSAERRHLTAMFCDLVGSTALAVRLDPEDMREVIRAYQACCESIVERFGGCIGRFMGDGILVYFGFPRATEHDPERAVRAALEIVAAVGQLKLHAGLTLRARVGIATGEVVIGELIGKGEAQERAATGETLNLAARLQSLAEPDSVVIAKATQRLVGGLFEYADLGCHTLKGFEQPMQAWRVVSERAVESRFEATHGETGLTPLVGRENEVELLSRHWQQAKAGKGRVVLLVGEAGIGKSRLAQTLQAQVTGEPHILMRYYCAPYYQNSALNPVITQLERTARFSRDDPPGKKLDKLEAVLAQAGEKITEMVPLFATLLSLPIEGRYPPLNLSPQRQKEKTLEALEARVANLAAQQPVLIIFEDLHWLDPTTQELLERLVDEIPHMPVLLLLTCRPEFISPWDSCRHVTTLALTRLSPQCNVEIVNKLTGGKELPPEVLNQIVLKTDGVPLFIEELTKTILETGFLKDAGDRYELEGLLPSMAVPSTLQDSLMARLDRLSPVKVVAQIGAVIGREFSYELLTKLSPLDDSALQNALLQLTDADLIQCHGAPPEARYNFRHALIQDAAYDSLLRKTRQNYHEKIALTLERDFPELVETQPERLAQHFTKAELLKKAVPYWLAAGRRAVASSANAEAVSQLNQGLACLGSLPNTPERNRQEVDFLSTLGTALSAVQGYASPEVERTYARAQELCEKIGETPQQFWVLWGLWAFHLVRAEHRKALELGNKMMRLAENRADTGLELEAHFSLGLSLFFMGELRPAREHLERTIALYEPDKHHANAYQTIQDAGVTSRSVAALCLWQLGETELASERSRQALALADLLSHPFSKAYALGCATWFNLYLHDMSAVQQRAQEVVALATEQGFVWWLIWGKILGGRALVDAGQTAEGIAQMRWGIEAWRKTGSGFTAPYFLALLAEACAADDRIDEALALLAEARELVDKTAEGFIAPELFRLEGELRLKQENATDNQSTIEACFEQALKIARHQGSRVFERRAAESLARLWQSQGKAEDTQRY